MKTKYLFFLLCIGIISSTIAQTTLKGNVVSKGDGLPIPGATIIANNETQNGVATDFDGNFSIVVNQSEGTITVSYIGFGTVELSYSGNQTFQVVLESVATSLDEIVLIGYGSSKKGDITSAIGIVEDLDNISSRAVGNLNDFLQGNIPGVTVLQQGGDPTSNSKIVIRGIGSINSEEEPLTIVDGVPYYGPAINPNDIASVSVLKDAAAAAIYGAQAASGVIVIETKKGKIGKPVISLDTYTGFRTATNLPTPLNAQQQAEVYNTAALNAGTPLQPGFDAVLYPYGQVTRTNWMDAIFRDAEIYSVNLNISGATENVNYMTSFGYNKTEGVLVGTGSERYSFRVKSEFDLTDKITVGENVYFSRTEAIGVNTSSPNSGAILSAIYMPSSVPTYDEDGNFHGSVPVGSEAFAGAFGKPINPLTTLLAPDTTNPTDYLNATAFLEYNIIEGLDFKTTYSYSITDVEFKKFTPMRTETGNPVFENNLQQVFTKRNRWVWDNQLTYIKSFGDHNLNLTAIYSSQKTESETYEQNADGFSSEEPFNQYMANATNFDIPKTSVYEDALTSAIGRAMYNYDDKYFASASIRRDQSSRLASGNQSDTFASATGAWKISNEDFFNIDAINDLKIRASWGQIGNISSVSFYSFDALLSSIQTVIIGEDGLLNTGTVRATTGSNPGLKWETSESINIGLDATLLDRRLSLTVDYFEKTTKNMILPGLQDFLQGTTLGDVNGGEVLNKGLEFSASYSDTFGDLNYTIRGNAFTLKNKLINLDGYAPGSGIDFITDGEGSDIEPFRSKVGEPLFSNYLIPYLGIFQTQAEIDAHALNGVLIQPQAVPGDFKFEDTNGDGQIDNDDKVYMGSYQPKLTYNFGLSLDYKGFDFNMNIQGVAGVNAVNSYKFRAYNPSLTGENLDRRVINAWTPTNTNTDIPRLSTQDPNANYGAESSWYLEDAAYVRLKNVTFGYTFPDKILKEASLRIYVSGENLLTITDYTGLDPEVGGKGLDNGKYPLARTITLGLSLKM